MTAERDSIMARLGPATERYLALQKAIRQGEQVNIIEYREARAASMAALGELNRYLGVEELVHTPEGYVP